MPQNYPTYMSMPVNVSVMYYHCHVSNDRPIHMQDMTPHLPLTAWALCVYISAKSQHHSIVAWVSMFSITHTLEESYGTVCMCSHKTHITEPSHGFKVPHTHTHAMS